MRVLWCTQTPLPAVVEHLGMAYRSPTWIAALADELTKVPGIRLAVASAYRHVPEGTLIQNGVEHFYFPQVHGLFRDAESAMLRKLASIVRAWRPDVIHIHGTEHAGGLISARKIVDVPVVISMQGILGPYSRWHNCFGAADVGTLLRMHRFVEPLVGRGLIGYYRRMKASAATEREIIRGNDHFLGRTDWDRAYIRAHNCNARYLHVGELLRKPFWRRSWALHTAQRHRIFLTNAGGPRKGLETLLDALELLVPDYPDIELAVTGDISSRNGYGRFIRRRMSRSGRRVVFLGYLDAEQLAQELCLAHVFVCPSLIDNSPNSLCEAMLLGMPCVCSYTGGMPSLIQEGHNGLFCPPCEVELLAARIRSIFEDDSLASQLGANAAVTAQRRHDPTTVLRQLLDAYNAAVSNQAGAETCLVSAQALPKPTQVDVRIQP